MADNLQPTNEKDIISLTPIGQVVNAFDEPTAMDILSEAESEVIIKPEYIEGLQGIQAGDAIMVLFHFHQSRSYALTQHPRGDESRPKRGVFALCSPHRPNYLGLTIVSVVSINGGRIKVQGLDAINGSPVIDIKPANRIRSVNHGS